MAARTLENSSNEYRPAGVRYCSTPPCQCRVSSIRASRTWSSKSFSVFRSSAISGVHQEDCPLQNSSRNKTVIGAKYSLCGIWLSQIVSFSIGITRGAGGSSISPNLSFCATVSENSCAFAFVRARKTFISLRDPGSTDRPPYMRHLYCLFQEQEASPFDRLPSGDTLLHVS